jgi:hypothetical protein
MIPSQNNGYPRHGNAGWGGHPARNRRERITSSLLGKDDGEIHCPRIIHIGFALQEGQDPLAHLHELMVDEGYDGPQDLRRAIAIPERSYICRPSDQPGYPLDSPPMDVLRQALMLGLCTAQLFDPQRPVVWTRSSLSRVVDLFDPQGFYQ